MKIKVSIQTALRLEPYVCDQTTLSQEEFNTLVEMCEDSASAKYGYFRTEINGNAVIFSKTVIANSIITIITL